MFGLLLGLSDYNETSEREEADQRALEAVIQRLLTVPDDKNLFEQKCP